MTQPTRDRPDIVIFPPVIILMMLVAAILLQWAMPLGIIAAIGMWWRIAIGVVLLAAGAWTTVNGRLALMRRGTNVNPLRPATALATDGIYRWTRNPMYTGVAPALIGAALIFEIDWLPLVMIPGYCLLHFGVVLREERYLEQKFGDAYRRYRMNVPRYVWPL